MAKHKKKGAKSIFGKGAQRFGSDAHSSLNKENGFVTPESKRGGKKKHKRGRKRG